MSHSVGAVKANGKRLRVFARMYISGNTPVRKYP